MPPSPPSPLAGRILARSPNEGQADHGDHQQGDDPEGEEQQHSAPFRTVIDVHSVLSPVRGDAPPSSGADNLATRVDLRAMLGTPTIAALIEVPPVGLEPTLGRF